MTRSWDYPVSFLMAFGVLTTWCFSGWILHGFVTRLLSPARLWCQVSKGSQKGLPRIQCAGHWRAGELDCSGGRPKAAIDHASLRRAAEGRPCLQFVDSCAISRKSIAPSKQFGHRLLQQLNRRHLYSDSVWPAFGGP